MIKIKKYLNMIGHIDVHKEDRSLPHSLLIREYSDTTFSTYYAPFDYVNPKAKVVICGITPGLQQALRALIEAKKRHNEPMKNMLFYAKREASFVGKMRSNLVGILDNLGLPKWLGIRTTDQLFDAHIGLAHFMSVLRYPVFLGEKNYSGTPSIFAERNGSEGNVLLSHLKDTFFSDLQSLPKTSIYIPLGPKVTEAFRYAEAKGIIKGTKVMYGMPHPSGENGEEVKLATLKSYPEKEAYISDMLHKYKQKKKNRGEILTNEQVRKYKKKRETVWLKILEFRKEFKNSI